MWIEVCTMREEAHIKHSGINSGTYHLTAGRQKLSFVIHRKCEVISRYNLRVMIARMTLLTAVTKLHIIPIASETFTGFSSYF